MKVEEHYKRLSDRFRKLEQKYKRQRSYPQKEQEGLWINRCESLDGWAGDLSRLSLNSTNPYEGKYHFRYNELSLASRNFYYNINNIPVPEDVWFKLFLKIDYISSGGTGNVFIVDLGQVTGGFRFWYKDSTHWGLKARLYNSEDSAIKGSFNLNQYYEVKVHFFPFSPTLMKCEVFVNDVSISSVVVAVDRPSLLQQIYCSFEKGTYFFDVLRVQTTQEEQEEDLQ